MTMHNTLIIVLLICAFVLHGGVAWAAPLQQKKLIFGIIPQQSVEAIDRSWAPLLRHISENSGYQVELQTTKNIASFKARVKSEEFDIAYMNPLMYVSEESRQYQAFAKEKDAKLNGIIVVEKNSPYYSLESLNGLSLAFPDLEAFAATLVPLSFLEKKGAHVKINIVGQHDAVYRAVATGAYPAGGGVAKTLEKSDEKTKGQLRVLWTSPAYTPHPFAAHRRVQREILAKILAVMVALEQGDEGKKLLKGIGFKGIEKVVDREYDDIRELN